MNPISTLCRFSSVLIVAVALLLNGCASRVEALAGTELTAVLAPGGKLRVGLYPGTPTSILPDSSASGPRGVGYDLGKALARRLHVQFEPIVFQKNAEVLEAIKSGKVDVAFTNASPARMRDMDFTTPYIEIELGYLVPSGTPVRSMAEIDRPGIRVGVTEKSSSDDYLSRTLKNATVVRATTVTIGAQHLAQGKADAFATNKATLFEMADELPGSQVLEGRWGVEKHALAIPKGRESGLPVAQKFIDEAKAEGLVKAAILRAGLRGAMVTDSK